MRSVLLAATALALHGLVAPAAEAQLPGSYDGAAAPISFWRALGDSTLQRLVGEALEENPELRAADARAGSVRAGRVEAALDLLPVVTASSSYSRQQLASANVPGAGGGALPEYGLWDAGIQMSWEVDVFGRGRRTLQGRSALVTAAEETVDDAAILLAADVADTYFELRGAQERLDVARQNAENQRRSLELTQERLAGGRGSGLDTERAMAQLGTTLAAIPALEAEIMAIRYRLGALTGRGAPDRSGDAPLQVGGAGLPALPAAPTLAAAAALIRERPDIRSAERRQAAQHAFVSAARADYLPRVSFDGRAGYTASALDGLGSTGTPRYAFGPVVSWPLLDLGRVGARVDAARAEESEAAARYEQAVLAAHAEVQSALFSYEKVAERLTHLEQAAAASERATELARLRFEEGATGFLEVLDAERTQLEAQNRMALGRSQAMAAMVAVYRALGGRWEIPGGTIE